MRIIVGSDDNYALPLSVTLHSALRRLAGDRVVDVTIVDAGISGASRRRIERSAAVARPGTLIRWVPADMAPFSGMHTTHWGSPASYLPLLIPELVDGNGSVLYLDSDLLVRADLSALWDEGLTHAEAPLHAVLDYGFHTLGEALKGDACSRLGIDPDAPYFNSGVLLINLGSWRAGRTAERAMDFARENPDVMRFTDQDALNVVMQGDWHQLDARWNVLVGSIERYADRLASTPSERDEMIDSLRASPRILHFSGPQKPWRPGYTRIGKKEYRDELLDCGWFEGPFESWRWRVGVFLASPFVRLQRRTIKAIWPLIKRARPDDTRAQPKDEQAEVRGR